MQNNTSKMVTLLGKIRKQMNGAVLDTFRYYGDKYGMNYGVAIHSVRQMATEQGVDHDLAQFLYRQQVRELQIIALWIADASCVDSSHLNFWGEGIINSELAEQAAQALLCNISDVEHLLDSWCASKSELLCYAALLAAARSGRVGEDVAMRAVVTAATHFANNHLAAKGLITFIGAQIDRDKKVAERLIAALPDSATANAVREEVEWRLEY